MVPDLSKLLVLIVCYLWNNNFLVNLVNHPNQQDGLLDYTNYFLFLVYTQLSQKHDDLPFYLQFRIFDNLKLFNLDRLPSIQTNIGTTGEPKIQLCTIVTAYKTIIFFCRY